MKRYLPSGGRSRARPVVGARLGRDDPQGRRPARRLPRPDGGGRRAQGPALQDRVERVPGRRSAARGPQRRGHRHRHRRRCALHLRGRLGGSDPGHPGDAGRIRAASPCWCGPTRPCSRFADLKGKRIGTGRGSVGHQLVLAALEDARSGQERCEPRASFSRPRPRRR